jgi:hypothetical protein
MTRNSVGRKAVSSQDLPSPDFAAKGQCDLIAKI